MIKLIERIFTKSMRDYPYCWIGEKSGGVISVYCDSYGFVLHGPHKRDLVFEANTEGSPAFEVTYANERTRRIRVKETPLQIAYNEVLRNHLKRFPNVLPHPDNSQVSLVEIKGR